MYFRYLLKPPESSSVSGQIYSLEVAHSEVLIILFDSFTTVWISEHRESSSSRKLTSSEDAL